jgi:hypothetical protein
VTQPLLRACLLAPLLAAAAGASAQSSDRWTDRLPEGGGKKRPPSCNDGMAGHECYHCKQWVAKGEAHDWTTTEAALTKDLSEDLRDPWERLRECADLSLCPVEASSPTR